MDDNAVRIIVTGEPDERPDRFPEMAGDRPLEWIQVPVLRFERLPVTADRLEALLKTPPEWILFTSARSVRYWAETLLEHGRDFPIETQVACIGGSTADVAGGDGFTADFYPTDPGTEKFLEEFEELLSNNTAKPSVFIPMAEGGRRTISERLTELGCTVDVLPLYRTLPKDEIDLLPEVLEKASLILFTSPSSVDALMKRFKLPPSVPVASLGRYTSDYLTKKGFTANRVLPGGDFHRIGEIL